MNKVSRRTFMKTTAGLVGMLSANSFSKPPQATKDRNNFLLIICDQLTIDAINYYGCNYAHTPNIDRLLKRSTSFLRSHSTSAVCSPARSSIMTSRMPIETGVMVNHRRIIESIPDMGQWFRQAGYETVHCGKWHLPDVYPTQLKGFDVLPVGSGQGDLVDPATSRSTESYLLARDNEKPFLLVSSLVQPHDICYWNKYDEELVPNDDILESLKYKYPELPYNFDKIPKEPAKLANCRYEDFTKKQWEYYSYVYYRQVEMVDSDIGRILDALEASGYSDNTIVVFTADHGEGLGHHQLVQKWHPYEHSVIVPLALSLPGKIPEDEIDDRNLVSGLDILPTMCDYADIEMPPKIRGLSLKPLIENKDIPWREHLVIDTNFGGQLVRTDKYKYTSYPDDKTKMLFDIENDPYETKNIYNLPEYAGIVEKHKKILNKWNEKMIVAQNLYRDYYSYLKRQLKTSSKSKQE